VFGCLRKKSIASTLIVLIGLGCGVRIWSACITDDPCNECTTECRVYRGLDEIQAVQPFRTDQWSKALRIEAVCELDEIGCLDESARFDCSVGGTPVRMEVSPLGFGQYQVEMFAWNTVTLASLDEECRLVNAETIIKASGETEWSAEWEYDEFLSPLPTSIRYVFGAAECEEHMVSRVVGDFSYEANLIDSCEGSVTTRSRYDFNENRVRSIEVDHLGDGSIDEIHRIVHIEQGPLWVTIEYADGEVHTFYPKGAALQTPFACCEDSDLNCPAERASLSEPLPAPPPL
jgi:hypothetical protein